MEGDTKAPFSIVTTPGCRGRHYSFPRIALLTLDPYFIMLSVKQEDIKYHFLSLWYDSTWDWNPVSRTIGKHYTHYANGPIYIYIYIYREREREREREFRSTPFPICRRNSKFKLPLFSIFKRDQSSLEVVSFSFSFVNSFLFFFLLKYLF